MPSRDVQPAGPSMLPLCRSDSAAGVQPLFAFGCHRATLCAWDPHDENCVAVSSPGLLSLYNLARTQASLQLGCHDLEQSRPCLQPAT